MTVPSSRPSDGRACSAGCSEADLAALAPMLRQRRFRAGETIFHEGDPGDAMHVIASGRAKISIESLDGEEAILVTLGPGEVFGELVLLDGAPRSATAVAVEPTVTYILTQPSFGPLLAGNEAFRTAILHNLALDLRRLTVHASELHFLDLAGRLASRLAHMAEEVAPGRETDVHLGRSYTQIRARGDDRRDPPEREPGRRRAGLGGPAPGRAARPRHRRRPPDGPARPMVKRQGSGGDLSPAAQALLREIGLRGETAIRLDSDIETTLLRTIVDATVGIFAAEAASIALLDEASR